MPLLSTHPDPLYRAYREELVERGMVRAGKAAALFVIGLNSSFIPLDLWAHGEDFPVLVGLRMAWNLALVLLYVAVGRFHPVPVIQAGLLSTGFFLIGLIGAAGGASSSYWPGLMILFVGMPVVLPLSAREALGIVAILSAGFAALPIATGEGVTLAGYGVPLFFVVSTAAECVYSCARLERLRFAELKQRRELEEARDHLREMDRAKSRFTANVHHELRTPLTLMLAPLEAMLGGDFGKVSELQAGYLKTMHTNAQRLLKLINNLLDLAKIEGKQLEVRRRPLRVGETVEGIVAGARPLAERKGVALRAGALEGLPVVNVDPEALEKIVVNLVGNALKFTPRGGSIEVRGEAFDAGGVELQVRDTGEGIPPKQLERIFDRFAQVDGSSTRRHEGTGIGLALVKELVELHGGRIWAESEGLGRGSTFRVVLPRGEADAELADEILATDEHEPAPAAGALAGLEGEVDFSDVAGDGPGSGERAPARRTSAAPGQGLLLAELQRSAERSEGGEARADDGIPAAAVPPDAREVLIVEDNADMRRLLAFLVGQEYRVRVARNGREALERLRERRPDLVLTDVMMPEMSGIELCHAIKADPDTRGIPVVLVTSKAEREMKIQGLERGAEDYVTKPFHPRELLARVRSLVRLHDLQEELASRNALLEETNAELERALADLRQASAQLVQAERLAAVGELAAGIAHEVNNPINFATNALGALRSYVDDVRGVAERLAALPWHDPERLRSACGELEKLGRELDLEQVSSSLDELAAIVTEGLGRTSRLVGDLRDFAAPGRGPRAPVDLVRGIQSSVHLIGHAARAAGAEIRVSLPERLPPFEGDARALNQVFLNLLKNAAEALAGRGGVIEVRARSEQSSIVVQIQDDGPGVAPELQARIFEPFFSTKGAGRGTGLGLPISRRIVMEHGGSIEMDSTPGQGTTFTVRLPVSGGERAA